MITERFRVIPISGDMEDVSNIVPLIFLFKPGIKIPDLVFKVSQYYASYMKQQFPTQRLEVKGEVDLANLAYFNLTLFADTVKKHEIEVTVFPTAEDTIEILASDLGDNI